MPGGGAGPSPAPWASRDRSSTAQAESLQRRPTLSVTVTNYNYGRFLRQNLESIRTQSFPDFELIVIDNASTDDSVEIIREHAAVDPRVRVVAHEKNEGALASLRESCDLCRGLYRVHVDADDWVLSPDAFRAQVELLEANPQVAFVYSSMILVGPGGEKLCASRPYAGNTILPGALALETVLGFNITHSGMMFRLDAYRETGGYPEGLPHADDMLLAVRLSEKGDVGYLDRELYAFRQHGANVHLAPELRVVEREILPIIAAAFEGPLGAQVPDSAAVRRRVTRNALVHLPTQCIFRGETGAGWRLYWESVKTRPVETLFQGRTLSLLARSLLGESGYRWLSARLGST